MLEEIKKIKEDEYFIQYEYKANRVVTYNITFCLEHKCVEITPIGTVGPDPDFVRINKKLLGFLNKMYVKLGWM